MSEDVEMTAMEDVNTIEAVINEDTDNFNREFVCVEYPGIIKNEDKMIKTLGGIECISNVISSQNKRLCLHYRPEDPTSKPVYLNREKIEGLLVKVKVPKKKRPLNESDKTDYKCTVLGVVSEEFNCQAICDFQYLPQTSGSKPEQQEALHHTIFPDSVEKMTDWINDTEFKETLILPAAMSRLDLSNYYCYRSKEIASGGGDEKEENKDIKVKTWSKQRNYTQMLVYDKNFQVPTEPLPAHLQQVYRIKGIQRNIDIVKKMFQDRPIWSKNALKYNCNIKEHTLKAVLPCVAYYFKSGPWRLSWVRHGYNPITEPESRYYQMLEYRIISTKMRIFIKKRDRGKLIYAPQMQKNKFKVKSVKKEIVTNNEVFYKFRKGFIPPHRVMLYQLIDIELDEIQSEISKNVARNCEEKSGWLSLMLLEKFRRTLEHEVIKSGETMSEQNKELDLILKTKVEQLEEDEPVESLSESSDDSSLIILSDNDTDESSNELTKNQIEDESEIDDDDSD